MMATPQTDLTNYAALNAANVFTVAPQQITINNAANIGQIIKAAGSQSANLTEWRNSSNVILSRIGADGTAYAPRLDASSGAVSTYQSARIGLPDSSKISWHTNSDGTGGGDIALVRSTTNTLKLTDSSTGMGFWDARAVNLAVASLPASAAGTKGRLAFATNGRKTGEGAAAGTGTLCYDDGTAWRRVSDDTTVVA